jgi:hypothetical protein
MSSQGNGEPVLYAVRMSGQTKATLKKLHARTRQAGTSKRFLAAVRRAVERLQREPLNLGEPLYRLPALRLLVRQAVVDIVVVDFAVHEEQPLVFIRKFGLLG